ncbi:MAG TPA: 2OG-Fe(II) oxygenase [Thermoanaerobaculia bacterium]|jgi:SM-20-related protein
MADLERIVEDLAESGRSIQADFLAPAEVRALREEAFELWRTGAFRQAGVGAGAEFGVRPEIRSDRILWLEEPYTEAQRRYLDQLERLRLAINQSLYLGLFSFEGHLAVYPPGASYKKHLDRFQNAGHRVVSTILYLNEDWMAEDGGQLRLYDGPEEDTGHRDVLPAGGNFAIFLSGSIYHEVLPATRERVSLTGWFRTRE